MGQQQILLIFIAVVIIGIAIVGGIALFNAEAVAFEEDEVNKMMIEIAEEIQVWAQKPEALGGAGQQLNRDIMNRHMRFETLVACPFEEVTNGGTVCATANGDKKINFGFGPDYVGVWANIYYGDTHYKRGLNVYSDCTQWSGDWEVQSVIQLELSTANLFSR